MTDTRAKGREDVVFRQLGDDEWVVYDPEANQLHTLNLSAALIWSHCTGDMTAEQIAESVGSAYEPPLSADHVVQSVRESLERFRESGLLE